MWPATLNMVNPLPEGSQTSLLHQAPSIYGHVQSQLFRMAGLCRLCMFARLQMSHTTTLILPDFKRSSISDLTYHGRGIDDYALAPKTSIGMCTGALNFKDVMLAYGKLPREFMTHTFSSFYLGFEFSGTLATVHAEQTPKRVMGMARSAIATTCGAPAPLVRENSSCPAQPDLGWLTAWSAGGVVVHFRRSSLTTYAK